MMTDAIAPAPPPKDRAMTFDSDDTPLQDALLRQVLDRADDAIAIYTAADWAIASTLVYANQALLELSGYTDEHFVGHSALLLAGARPDSATIASILPSCGARELRARTRKQRPDGSTYEVDVVVTPLSDKHGRVSHYVSSQRQVDAAPAVSAELLGRVRGDAMSELSAGVAYELEALLSRCVTNLARARAASRRGEPNEASLDAVSRAVESMSATLRGLKAFSIEDDQMPGPINLHEAIELAVRIAGPTVRRRATIERRYVPVGAVHASLPELSRALTAILRNAGESIPCDLPDANHVVIETAVNEATHATITIHDTGVGIESRDLPFVFAPFFSTKPSRSGLGLAAARVYVESIGGSIRAESAVGRGTRICISLPLSDMTRIATGAPAYMTTEAPESRLLAIADTHGIAATTAEPFMDGHVVLSAATWGEGLERLALGESFDLVLCDGRSPRASEFRARSRELSPDARVFEMNPASAHDSGEYLRLADDDPFVASAE
jgi:PAS domain S-box-containing protein